jgi:hypothetical protein
MTQRVGNCTNSMQIRDRTKPQQAPVQNRVLRLGESTEDCKPSTYGPCTKVDLRPQRRNLYLLVTVCLVRVNGFLG